MRRSLVAAALLLSTGGWVCDSAGPCPQGELTCSSEVADHVCCPQGFPYRCNGHCSATPQCSDYVVCKYPEDPGSGLCTAGAYTAAIQGIACTPPTAMYPYYQTMVFGTLAGCGSTPVLIQQSPALTLESSACGTWRTLGRTENGAIECVPRGTEPEGTSWEVQSVAYPGGTAVSQVSVAITLDLGDEPVIAQATLACPPSP